MVLPPPPPPPLPPAPLLPAPLPPPPHHEDDDEESIDRTSKPPVPEGYHEIPVKQVKEVIKSSSWIEEFTDLADGIAFQFECDGAKMWFTGSDLREGECDTGELGLCVTYHDGDKQCHTEPPDIKYYNKTWYLVAEDD